MKKAVAIVPIIFSILFFLSCGPDFFYKMPHEPGLFVDKESFEEHKLLWEEAGIEDYSYTYSYDNDGYPKENYVVDVVVSGGKVESFILKEYCGESLADKSMNEWESEAKQFYENTERDSSFLLIDKVFEMIDQQNNNSELKE